MTDAALKDPIAASNSRLYIAYAEYSKDRDKLANAQKAYIRGLSSGLSQEDVDEIWRSFLSLMQRSGLEVPTVSQLYGAVCEQVEDRTSLSAPSARLLEEPSHMEIEQPENSAPVVAAESAAAAETSESMEMDGSRESALAGAVAAETKESEEEGNPENVEMPDIPELEEIMADLTPVELLTKFQKKPPFLFVAPTKVLLF